MRGGHRPQDWGRSREGERGVIDDCGFAAECRADPGQVRKQVCGPCLEGEGRAMYGASQVGTLEIRALRLRSHSKSK